MNMARERGRRDGRRAGLDRAVGEAGATPTEGMGEAEASDWAHLDRLLVLGSERGALRAGAQAVELAEVECSIRCVRSDAGRVVTRLMEIQASGQASPNGSNVLVLALVTAFGDDEGRSAACAAVPAVCRTAGELFQFAERVTSMRGWGRGLRRAVGNWYRARFADDLAYQVVKCPRRGGWSHRDLLRLAHPTPATREQAAVFRWILGGSEALGRRTVVREMARSVADDSGEGAVEGADWEPRRFRAVTYPGVGELPRLLRVVEEARRAATVDEVVRIIAGHDLPREAVPGSWLEHTAVWEALLHRMPLGAMIRDLGQLTAVGLVRPGSEAAWWVETRLRDAGVLRAAGLHPMAYLLARRAYESGVTEDGRYRWEPVSTVVGALDAAFYASMRGVRPVGRPMLLALDLSASTCRSFLPGTRVSVLEAAAAMALVAVSTEASCWVAGLRPATGSPGIGIGPMVPGLTLLEVLPGMRLDDWVAELGTLPGRIPDCGQPMAWARRHRLPVEAFVVYTDGEVWPSEPSPAEALSRYRAETGIEARSVVVGMSGGAFEIADPADPAMLDVQGFDAGTAEVIAGFLRGRGN